MITILGPTATGKTAFAALIAHRLGGEIISADSRQVYKGMNIGTGKDYDDYIIKGEKIPCHLIDIVDPGYEYNIFEYQAGFLKAYHAIVSRNKLPVLCGGTGLYIESVLKGYKMVKVPVDKEKRTFLETKNDTELTEYLASFRFLHNITDTSDRERLVRAIEIQEYYHNHPELITSFPTIKNDLFGIYFDRQIIRRRITTRLEKRLNEGMIDEVSSLIDNGVTPEKLKFYGLEYKFITQYLLGELGYDGMFEKLNIAIHQFAKRQMTWFRKMERSGFKIHWIDGELTDEEKLEIVLKYVEIQ